MKRIYVERADNFVDVLARRRGIEVRRVLWRYTSLGSGRKGGGRNRLGYRMLGFVAQLSKGLIVVSYQVLGSYVGGRMGERRGLK
jgi:hypothetical protein